MQQTNPTIAILGSGAMGLYYGGRLAQAGHAVHFHARSDAEVIRKQGIRVRSAKGDFALPRVNVYASTREMPKVDLVIVTLKSTAREHYRELISPLLHENTRVFCLQNGFGNEEAFTEIVGGDASRVSGAIAFTCITRPAPGEAHHTSHGHIRFGEHFGPARESTRQLEAMFRAANIDAEAVDDLPKIRWEKLVWNIPFNGYGAALDLHCAQLLKSEAGTRLVRETMREVVRAASATGVSLREGLIDDLIAHTYPAGDYYTSMQLDRRSGRAMEVAAILAEPIRRAGERCELPLMRSLLATLSAVDAAR
jgi:2-dehydropantoate 2-reductase